jgi:creatinine amidohydrolase/Fe(II)-dependent formamide hydrolase-like protein
MVLQLGKKNPELMNVWTSLFATPTEVRKGGASHELSGNGVWCLSDRKAAKPETGEKIIQGIVDQAVKFIEAWKQAKNKTLASTMRKILILKERWP